MNDADVIKVLHYEMSRGGAIIKCRLHVCADGGVYIEGDEVEVIFEEGPDLEYEAIRYVEGLGYREKR